MTLPRLCEQDDQKRAAAARAIAEVEDGMVLGLGSGSTAGEAVAARIANGLGVAVAILGSGATAASARQLRVPLSSVAEDRRIDVTIDGADRVERGTLYLVKGPGRALLRESILTSASDRMIVVVDETKLVDRLGRRTPLPIATVSFGWQTTLDRLSAFGCEPPLRRTGYKAFTTKSYIVDCIIAGIPHPAAPEGRLCAGVVESGLFGLASKSVVGRPTNVEVIVR